MRDVQTLLQFCRAGMDRGFDGCIQAGLERILASPYFLFRVEGRQAGRRRQSRSRERPPASGRRRLATRFSA